MPEAPDPESPVGAFVKRAEHIASGAEHHVPSWLRPGDPESRWPVLIAILAVIVIQRSIPVQYTVLPRWPLIIMELLLLVINPVRLSRPTTIGKWASLILTAAITVDNTASAVILDKRILTGEASNNAAVLLGSGSAIFVTNIIAFGIWYWELDRGGPFARREGRQPYPDFLFPQMSDPNMPGRVGGRLSSTTSTSASPTSWRSPHRHDAAHTVGQGVDDGPVSGLDVDHRPGDRPRRQRLGVGLPAWGRSTRPDSRGPAVPSGHPSTPTTS